MSPVPFKLPVRVLEHWPERGEFTIEDGERDDLFTLSGRHAEARAHAIALAINGYDYAHRALQRISNGVDSATMREWAVDAIATLDHLASAPSPAPNGGAA